MLGLEIGDLLGLGKGAMLGLEARCVEAGSSLLLINVYFIFHQEPCNSLPG